MRAYVDTNILVDLVLSRQEFLPNAQRVFAIGYAGEKTKVSTIRPKMLPSTARPSTSRQIVLSHATRRTSRQALCLYFPLWNSSIR